MRRLLPLATVLAGLALHAAPASASTTQAAIFQDDTMVKLYPASTLATLKSLGVSTVRVGVTWSSIAPAGRREPRGFKATSPADPRYDFAMYDAVVRDAQQAGITVFFTITGPAPQWAEAPGEPAGGFQGVWKPSAKAFGQFVQAVGKRYSGTFRPAGAATPLPAVRFWSIWNEPNYGYNLAPQAIDNDTVEYGAMLYRGLVQAAWKGLEASGHRPGRDTILIGETAPRGVDHPIGNFNGVKPLRFLRALYCVDSHYRPLRGTAARLRGCPTTAAGTRAFRSQNPALFQASGFAAHLYPSQAHPQPPNVSTGDNGKPGVDPDYADLPGVGRLEATLDRLNRVYGSHTRFGIWNTEYGYRTQPPDPHAGVSLAAAALYINWAEYLSYMQPRLHSYDQYLLVDPQGGVFASGLEFPNGTPKPDYWAYRMPIFLPVTSARHGHAFVIWGAARPAPAAAQETHQPQRVVVQYRRGGRGAWTTRATYTDTNSSGYLLVRLTFPASGSVRLAWTPPSGPTEHSRTVAITVR